MAELDKIYELLGKENFEPTEDNTDERIEMLESAIIELAEILVGGE